MIALRERTLLLAPHAHLVLLQQENRRCWQTDRQPTRFLEGERLFYG